MKNRGVNWCKDVFINKLLFSFFLSILDGLCIFYFSNWKWESVCHDMKLWKLIYKLLFWLFTRAKRVPTTLTIFPFY